MPKAVFKYPCSPDTFSIIMPGGAEILSVQHQSDANIAELWAIVEPEAPIEVRYFHIAGTGHPLPENIKAFLGTFQLVGGELVFHAFELHGEGRGDE